MEDIDEPELYREATERSDLPFVLLIEQSDWSIASEAIRSDVEDYFRKAVSGPETRLQSEQSLKNTIDSDHTARTDGAGGGLFELLPYPVVEYAPDSADLTVRRVNQAFIDSFNLTTSGTGTPLAAVLKSVGIANEDGKTAVLEHAREHEETVAEHQCETSSGPRTYRVRTVRSQDQGYLIFGEVLSDQRVNVLEYLAHNLRNPLEAATLHTEAAIQTGTLDHLDTVVAAQDQMEAIIDDSMKLAEQGSVTDELTPVNVASVATDAWQTTSTGAAELEVIDPGVVTADERRLRVLLENLFRNAVRHGPSDDIPDDELVVTVGATSGGFFISDNGQGVAPDKRAQLLDAGYTTDPDGTGLGLPIVADIADNHGWTVSVAESESGGIRIECTGITRPTG